MKRENLKSIIEIHESNGKEGVQDPKEALSSPDDSLSGSFYRNTNTLVMSPGSDLILVKMPFLRKCAFCVQSIAGHF
jgi:hypothetical protein